MNLPEYSLNNKLVIYFFLALIMGGGILAFNRLSQEEDAPLVMKQAVLICQYPGATVEEVEEQITTVIEREIQTMPNVYKIKGESRAGYSSIHIELNPGTNPASLSQMWDELHKKVYDVQPKLPVGASEIIVNDDLGDVYGIYFGLTADDGISYRELRDKAREIKTILTLLEGVRKVNTVNEQTEVMLRVNGQKAIGIAIATAQDKDVVKVGKLIRKTIDEKILPELPYGYELVELYPEDAIAAQVHNDFIVNLLLSVAFVIVWLYFFYTFRATLLISTSLVFCIAATVFTMQFTGTGLNRSSLAAFIIAVGMLVYNAIVVTDNAQNNIKRGMRRSDALIQGAVKPMWGLLGATLIGIISFLPFYLAESSVAEIVHPLFVVLAVSLLYSWLLALTQTTVFGDFMLKENAGETLGSFYNKPFFQWFENILKGLIRYRWLTIGCVIILLFITIAIIRIIPSNFFPFMDKPYFRADLFLPGGYGIHATSEEVKDMETYFLVQPGIKKVSTSMGNSHPRYCQASTSYSLKPNFANLLIEVNNRDSTAYWENMFYRYVRIMHPDIICRSSLFTLSMPPDGTIEILFSGENKDTLQQLANEAMRLIRKDGLPVEFLRTNWGIKTPACIPHFNLQGDSYVLEQVADSIQQVFQYPMIWHFQREQTIVVQMDPVKGIHTNTTFRSVWKLMNDKMKVPEGYNMFYQGEQDLQDQTNRAIVAKLPLVLILIFIVLLFLFGNYKRPLAVMAMIPLIFVGVVAGLLVFGKDFDFFVLLGVLGLVGMNVRSAVILVDEIVWQGKEGRELLDAVIYAAKTRVIPVSAAAGAIIVGIAPLLTDAMFGGMAATVMGGLLVATLLTILVLPVVYAAIYRV